MKQPFWTRNFLLFILFLSIIPLQAQTAAATDEYLPPDSIRTDQTYHLSFEKIAIPASMTVAGYALTHVKNKGHLNDGFQALNKGHRFPIDDYAQYLPLATSIFAGCLGAKHKHSLIDRTLYTLTSSAITFGIARCIKHFTWEPRPGGNSDDPFKNGSNSFPSGHTATAFTGAELTRLEYGGVVSIATYSVAAMVGILRIYNNKHWINDVVAGAGIGILSARIGYWLLEYEKNLIRKISQSLFHRNSRPDITSLIVTPYSGETSTFGCSIIITI